MDRTGHDVTARRIHGPLGFRIIGGFKLIGALLLIALGVGVLRLVDQDVGGWLTWAITTLRLDPHNHYIQSAISWASGVSPDRLTAIGVGTFFYAALYLVESLGLIFERPWAAYLTVVATGALIPLEGYEVFHKISAIKVLVLVVNVGVVIYLMWKLVEERRAAGQGAVAGGENSANLGHPG
jgi:uncharacterized membrane protein (DUF2068 family)